VIGWFPYVLMVAAILFAFSTSITWYYYGERSFVYLSNNSGAVKLAYKISFIAALIIGSSMTLNSIFDFAAAMLFAMAIPNMIGLYIMAPEVRRMLKSYLARVKSGEIKEVK
ncbi:MAG: alanine:cation symporter family protein, partial [Proteobacteria bacterium]|nr:alanine:cation symporter family protein [Pseudomonadota bacterium]